MEFMNYFTNKICVFILLGLSLANCGGESSKEKKEPLPKEITLSVSLPQPFYVKPGEMFEINASGNVTPYHPDIKLIYIWDKLTYKKSLADLTAEFGGSMQKAISSGVKEAEFARGSKIVEIAPDLEPGGHVIYTVRIFAEGYILDIDTNRNQPLFSVTSAIIKN